MSGSSVSAPGKAVLSGEYAVLDGAPAISMAVNRRARVVVAATENEFHSIASPGLHERTLRFRCTGEGAVQWLDVAPPRADCALLEHVWQSVRPRRTGGLALTLDTRDFFDKASGLKLGFGSSAALAAALTAALYGKDVPAADVYRTAAMAHRNFQAGLGSGVDVATAVFGGVIGFAMHEPRTEELRWPAGLQFGLLWSGKPADTSGKLAQFGSRHRDRAAATSSGKLAAAAGQVYEAWKNGGAAAVVASLREYAAALQRFSVDHDLGVFDAGHRELFDEAERRGLVYKPCGAGGGDIGVVFALQRAEIADFADRARNAGFILMDIQPDLSGVLHGT